MAVADAATAVPRAVSMIEATRGCPGVPDWLVDFAIEGFSSRAEIAELRADVRRLQGVIAARDGAWISTEAAAANEDGRD